MRSLPTTAAPAWTARKRATQPAPSRRAARRARALSGRVMERALAATKPTRARTTTEDATEQAPLLAAMGRARRPARARTVTLRTVAIGTAERPRRPARALT